MSAQHVTVVIPQHLSGSQALTAAAERLARHGDQRGPRVQDAVPQQQQLMQQLTALQPVHYQQQQPGEKQQSHLTQQQLQQYWLQAQGLQLSMDDLASYVDHMASASAKSALSLQQATWQEKQQLESIVKQQSARLQQQAAELEVLRGLARQQGMQQQLQQPAQQESVQDSRLQRQLEFHRQEIAAWYTKYSREKQGRVMAESAMQDTLVIVEQLEQECVGISSMLRDVMAIDAAAAAEAEAEAASKKRWRPMLGKMTRMGVTVQIGAAVFVAGCASVASAYIALSIR